MFGFSAYAENCSSYQEPGYRERGNSILFWQVTQRRDETLRGENCIDRLLLPSYPSSVQRTSNGKLRLPEAPHSTVPFLFNFPFGARRRGRGRGQASRVSCVRIQLGSPERPCFFAHYNDLQLGDAICTYYTPCTIGGNAAAVLETCDLLFF